MNRAGGVVLFVLAVLYMRLLISQFYKLPTWILVVLYGLLSIVLLCVCMGVPVFQLGLGLAGHWVAQ